MIFFIIFIINLTEYIKSILPVWKRAFSLAWPITVDKSLRTLMRTTDIIVTGLFSPAAIAAIGIADLYARLPSKIGSGLGSGAISLSSQDTGSGELSNRDESITQAFIIGIVLGIPIGILGILFGYHAVRLLGASQEVAQMGGAYLGIIFLTTPARHAGYIGSKSLQGTGDTVTPMKVNLSANFINIIITVSLGLGLGALPRLEIVGVAIGTAVGNVYTAIAFLYAIYKSSSISYVKPKNTVITKQLIAVSWPKIVQGLSTTVAQFPFNSILLLFGTEVNAAWQVSRRLYQQLTGPFSRAIGAASTIIIGQDVGAAKFAEAKTNSVALLLFGLVATVPLGIFLIILPEPFVRIFTSDENTVSHAIWFTIMYGAGTGFAITFRIYSGVFQGAGDTKRPLVAELIAVFGSYVAFAYIGAVFLGYGVEILYASILVYHLTKCAIISYWFYNSDWIGHAEEMLRERGSIS